MAEVYVRFTNDPVVRTMTNEEGDIRCDVAADGVLVGVALNGAVSVTIDGETAEAPSGLDADSRP